MKDQAKEKLAAAIIATATALTIAFMFIKSNNAAIMFGY